MKSLFDTVSFQCSKEVTSAYSTSFYFTSRLLASSIRGDIFNIYGFVRFADEIVDSFHGYEKEYLLDKFEKDLFEAIEQKISLNPILNSFQHTVNKYEIDLDLIQAFLNSMRMDLHKNNYLLQSEYEQYIYGSADVVGLMCLMVFVNGNEKEFNALKSSAVKLGSAFQKVNFLRDLKQDVDELNRTYFPNIDPNNFRESDKKNIIREIEQDFSLAKVGIRLLPSSSKFGVYVAFKFYSKLLDKLKKTSSKDIKQKRIRISKLNKIYILVKSYIRLKLNSL